MDYSQLSYWVLVCAFFLVAPFLIGPGRTERLQRLGHWAAERATAIEPEGETLPDDLYQVLRADELESSLRRVQRLLAIDEGMSAVRQLGNRLAYEQLLRDWKQVEHARSRLGGALEDGAYVPAAPAPVLPVANASAGEHRPRVETLEIGWR